MRSRPSFQMIISTIRYAVLPIVVIGGVVLTGVFFFWHGEAIMVDELKDRIRGTAALAATQIDPDLTTPLRSFADTKKPQYRTLVTQLDRMRDAIPNIEFLYIMRPTADPLTLEFVADADGLATTAELDANENGIVDPDEEPGHPGDPYDISETPALQNITEPAVDSTFTVDQWGTFISGYAPIRNEDGEIIAIIGVDMKAQDFNALSQRIFSPIALLLIAFAGVMMSAYVLIVVRHRRLEVLKQLDMDRMALMDLTTHQLGAPLATFKWWIEILREHQKVHHHKGKDKREDDDAFDQLQEGIKRMDMVLTSLHTAMRMRGTEKRAPLTRVPLRTVLNDVKKKTADLLHGRRQTLDMKLAPGLAVMVDIRLFTGVLLELVENASWYSPDKSVISIRAVRVRSKVQIQVEDHGYGIAPKDLTHIFEQFRRGSAAMQHKPIGNGLGLSIAKEIIVSSGGTIRVESEAGKGTLFTITLPLA